MDATCPCRIHNDFQIVQICTSPLTDVKRFFLRRDVFSVTSEIIPRLTPKKTGLNFSKLSSGAQKAEHSAGSEVAIRWSGVNKNAQNVILKENFKIFENGRFHAVKPEVGFAKF